MTPEEIEAEALKLDPAARSRLIQSLTRSLQTLTDNEAERLWIQEAMKRSRELRAAQPPAPEAAEPPAVHKPAPARKKTKAKKTTARPRSAQKHPRPHARPSPRPKKRPGRKRSRR